MKKFPLKPKGVPYAIGQYEDREEGHSKTLMRSHFLQLCSNFRPEMLMELARDIYPLYRRTPLLCFEADRRRCRSTRREARQVFVAKRRPPWPVLEASWIESGPNKDLLVTYPQYYSVWHQELAPDQRRMPVHNDPRITNFVSELFSWSTRHYLDAPWCRERAFETLDLWAADDEYLNNQWWLLLPSDPREGPLGPILYSSTWELAKEAPDFELSITLDLGGELAHGLMFYPYYPRRVDVQNALDKLNQEWDIFRDRIKDYLKKREGAASTTRLERSIEKKSPEHLEWFARIQTGESTYDDITREIPLDEYPPQSSLPDSSDRTKKVRSAVNHVSRLIGLPVRKDVSRSGRRPNP